MNDGILKFELPKDKSSIIKVIGVGGGGCNAVRHMHEQGIRGVDFIVCNTDAQSLETNPVPNKIQIGKKGLGAGSIPTIGRESAIEDIGKLREAIETNTEMIFITAGMGGGTGTGAAPVIAELAKEMGILTVGIVTLPFGFEGRKRRTYADEGIIELKNNVDALLIISNDKLRELYGNLKMTEAFGKADDILTTAAKSIAEIITCVGGINVDLEDVKTVMRNSGVAIMGNGTAEGENRAIKAVEMAMNSPLLNDNNIRGAKDILLYLTFGNDELRMDEITEITDYVLEESGNDVNVIWGYGHDNTLNNEIKVSVIATGFNSSDNNDFISHKSNKTIVSIIPENETKKIENNQPKEINIFTLEQVITPVNSYETNTFPKNINSLLTESSKKEIKSDTFSEKNNESVATNQSLENSSSTQKRVFLLDDEKKSNIEIEKQNANDKNNSQDCYDDNRFTRLRSMSTQIKTPQGLQEIEATPAYKRKEIQLVETPLSSEPQSSQFTINKTDDNLIEIKRKNPFLHDNVD